MRARNVGSGLQEECGGERGMLDFCGVRGSQRCNRYSTPDLKGWDNWFLGQPGFGENATQVG